MNVLGLIPARGGSKRVPGKNMRMLGGKPLIAWTIEAAICAGSLDRVVVSSEDEDILVTAQEWGAEIIDRPAWLASSAASSYDVVRHAIKALDLSAGDIIALLQPTSPFRTAGDIDAACSQHGEHPLASIAEGSDLPNGAIYCAHVRYWRKRFFSFDTYQYVLHDRMPAERSLDIDTPEDFAKAEAMVAGWTT